MQMITLFKQKSEDAKIVITEEDEPPESARELKSGLDRQ